MGQSCQSLSTDEDKVGSGGRQKREKVTLDSF